VWCEAYFDILKHVGVTCECNRHTYCQTDGQTFLLQMPCLTRLHGQKPTAWSFYCYLFLPSYMESQARTSCEKGVCLSVKRMDCDKTVERSVQIFIPYKTSLSLVFWEEKWLVGDDPFYLKFWASGPHWSEIADFQSIFTHSTSAVAPSKKSSGSRLRAFQWA